MNILNFIKDYWTILVFLIGIIGTLLTFIFYMIEAMKCSLRNDILTIYDKSKDSKKITHYQLEAMEHSAEIYFKLKGNSFVKDVLERSKKFELID